MARGTRISVLGRVDLADATPPSAATALTARVPSGTSSGTWVGGVGSFTVDLAVSRAASPDGPFESFRLGVLPADTDGVTLRAADLNLDTTVPADSNDRFLVGSSKIRFGRLALKSANGSQLVPLRVPLETQYWNGTVFVTNTADGCTSIANNNVQMSGFTANLTACETAITAPVTLSSGRGLLLLQPPGNANTGSVLLTANLSAAASLQACTAINGGTPVVPAVGANKTYLQGNWAGSAYVDNPSARAAFGTFKGAEEVIFIRENF
jgi:MSHA biogenesis protein MshQ